jgi:hypothetical protein
MTCLLRPLLAISLLAACAGPADDRNVEETAPVPSETADTTWAVSPEGIGPVRIGTALSELAPRLAGPADSAAAAGECAYVAVVGAPDSVAFMVEGGRLARIDVHGGAARTVEGAGTGDSEQRILELYDDVRREPHKYMDGSYLTAFSGADTMRRYVFETDGHRVTRYRAGLYPPVSWVEGCS